MPMCLSSDAAAGSLTYDFVAKLLKAAGSKLAEVRLEKLSEEAAYGILVVRKGSRVLELKVSVEEALFLAMKTRCPIIVARELMHLAGNIWLHDVQDDVDGTQI